MKKLIEDLEDAIETLEGNKITYPKMNTQNVINLLNRLKHRLNKIYKQ